MQTDSTAQLNFVFAKTSVNKDIDLIIVFSNIVAFTFLYLYLHNVQNVMKVYIILRLFKRTFKYQKIYRGMRIQ